MASKSLLFQEAFSKSKESARDHKESSSRRNRIHVRSKDPMRIAKQLEKSLNGGGAPSGKQSKNSKGVS